MAGTSGFSDRYDRLRPLGEGGSGRVWLVRDRLRPGPPLALKELAERARGHEEALRREFSTLTSLRHPNLVRVHEFDLAPETGLPRFSMEYVEGADLVAALRGQGPGTFAGLAVEALRALSFLHDFGLVHRDLKPANLLVRARSRPGSRLVVLDFGLARFGAAPDAPGDERLVGTLPYLAPELFEGAAAGPRSDLYALGAVLFEALHGAPAFQAGTDDATELIEKIRRGSRPRLAPPNGFPSGVAAWIDKLLAVDPASRPAKASEALARLNAACGETHPVETADGRRARLASGSPPGREEELRMIREQLAPGERPRLVWLCGEAGTGKTRVLRELASRAVLDGWRVETRSPGPSGDTLDREIETLRRASLERPVLVLLDEVESAEGGLPRFLETVARDGKAAPVQVVAALRPGEVGHPLVRNLLSQTGTVPTLGRVDLEPLEPAGIRALAERATGGAEISEARVRWLHEASEGSPLIVEALLAEGTWERGGEVPRSVGLERAVATRVEGVSNDARRWLESLAILGSDAPERLVTRLSGLDEGTGGQAAQELRSAGLARRRESRWSPGSRTIARQVLGSLGEPDSRALHRRAMRLLEQDGLGREEPWRAARIARLAGEQESAVALAVAAAEQSARDGDPATAAARYAFALRCMGRARGPRRAHLRTAQARALVRAGDAPGALRAFAAACRLADNSSDRAEILIALAEALVRTGRTRRAEQVLEKAESIARAEGMTDMQARAMKVLGMVYARRNFEDRAVVAFSRAVEGLRDAPDPEELAETLHYLAHNESRQDQPSAEEHFLEALELTRLHGLRHREIMTLLSFAYHCKRNNQIDDAIDLAEQVRRIAEEIADPLAYRDATHLLSVTAMAKGEFDRALVLTREFEDAARHSGDAIRVAMARNDRGEVLLGSGRPAEAAELIQETLTQNLRLVEPRKIDFLKGTLAESLLESPGSDPEQIARLLREAIQDCRRRHDLDALVNLLVVDLERRLRSDGTDSPAEILLELDTELAEHTDQLQPEYRIRLALARAAFLLDVEDEPEQAHAAARETAELADELDRPALGARACAVASRALDRLDRPGEAAAALDEGRRLLDTAAKRIADREMRSDFLARPVFAGLRDPDLPVQREADRRVMALYEMIHELNSEPDPECLLEKILDAALAVVRAERGMILLLDPEGEGFAVRLARNLEQETVADVEDFSRGVAERAGSGEAVLALDTERDERFKDLKSVSLFGIRSLMCVPLKSGGKIVGTVYLDSRKKGALFTQDDLRFVEAFADHAGLALANARDRVRLEQENTRLRAVAERRARFDNIVGDSPQMRQVFGLIEKVAASDLPVLIQGESGTGKELVASAIHFNGRRRNGKFVTESCAAIPETLLESALFGHVRGAFTGAEQDRQGLFEQADGGTLFLDEVGDMSPSMQARLLRVLQEGELRRVGGERTIRVDVRVLAATHRELETEVAAGRFREDLFYRLQVLPIRLPPLRERVGDLALLTDHILARSAEARGREAPAVAPEVREMLEGYSWPGNVRQLENVLNRLALLAGAGPIDAGTIASDPELERIFSGPAISRKTPVYSLEQNERERIRLALEAADGNRSRAAGMLGISRATIYRKIKLYDLGD